MNLPVDPAVIERAIALAARLQNRATQARTAAERRQQDELARLVQSPRDKATLVAMTDQAFRSHSPARTVEQFVHLLRAEGVPRFFSALDRTMLRGLQFFGCWMPWVAFPLLRERLRRESAKVVLPAEPEPLTRHLRARTDAGLRMNLNLLGETVLGESEAQRRLERCREALCLPELEVLSVKISTLYSQLSPLAHEATIARLRERLTLLYREALQQRFVRRDGQSVAKFVYLDMEEYRDLRLTAEAFMRTLDQPEFAPLGAGLALQAYLPDSAAVQQTLNAWARRRVETGGAPITIRLVKGANLEMERVEASLRGWAQAPFKTKLETDANYQRMLMEALRPENLAAVRVGVASHNLFDVALGLILSANAALGERVQFEMLEGMADHQRRALQEETRRLLLYVPACRKEDFVNAIGYLIRRLDENTGPENFLRHAFHLQVGSAQWRDLEARFRDASELEVSSSPRRTQNRLLDSWAEPEPEPNWRRFRNEPDTDFALPANVRWAEEILTRWQTRTCDLPVIVGGQIRRADRAAPETLDPSRPGFILGSYREGTRADVEDAMACARQDEDHWRTRPAAERSAILGKVARELRRARGDLIGAAMANGGKTIAEADPEVSEAIDFVEFYRAAARGWHDLPTVEAEGQGVVVVVPPWNFPIAIPCGGVAGALAAGNTVILKPASPTVWVAWELCQCFWRAGVSQKTLQFLPCPGPGAGEALVTHPDVNVVLLTGGTATAEHLLKTKPTLRLYAETGGKNATIVTALADREQAVKHVVHSAFSHSGQKCSATSLLLLEAEVYDDPDFRRMLTDAVASLPVGSCWDPATRVGPLIRPASGELAWALTSLDPGEEWAVTPRCDQANPNLWSPGVKYGVQPGSLSHRTEFFGPVLSVLRFTTLEAAIAIVNGTGYGLTSGLESLDDREIGLWKSLIHAGNLYINRPTTGAVVLRQPFGGVGKSAIGPGLKAGGPNYLVPLLKFTETAGHADNIPRPDHSQLAGLACALRVQASREPELERLLVTLSNYARAYQEEFALEHDHFQLLGEDNLRRYRPIPELRLRIAPQDTFFDLFARVAAAILTGNRITISREPGAASDAVSLPEKLTVTWPGGMELIEESDETLAEVIRRGEVSRIRYAGPERVPLPIRAAAAERGVYLADAPVLAEGRIELLWYLHEQSVSHAYHRYGNLGARATESRSEPL